MNSFNAYIYKEFKESIKEKRLFTLFISFFIFAIITPPMIKLLPEILKNSSDVQMLVLPDTTPLISIQNYSGKTLSQIGAMLICLLFGGLICNEFSTRKILFPLTKGASKTMVVFSKGFYYSLSIIFVLTLCIVSCGLYSNMLFTGESLKIINLLAGSLEIALYFVFLYCIVLFFSSIYSKPIPASISALTVHIILMILLSKNHSVFNPLELMNNGNLYSGKLLVSNIFINIFYCLIALTVTALIVRKKEISK